MRVRRIPFLVGDLARGVAERRAEWLCAWARRVSSDGVASGREFRGYLGRLAFSASLLRFLLPLLGPLYAWAACISDSSVWPVPTAVRIILMWVVKRLEAKHLVPLRPPLAPLPRLRFEADAKAEGECVVVGGFLGTGRDEDLRSAPWFSYSLDRSNAPWAFDKHGQAYRCIAALELFATLLCVVVLDAGGRGELPGSDVHIVIPGRTDNQSNASLISKYATSRFPLYVVLLELSEQLACRNATLDLQWVPRASNQHADDLTNGEFGRFDPGLRVDTPLALLPWRVMPALLEAAADMYRVTEELRAHRALGPAPLAATAGRRRPKKKARRGLRHSDPW